MTLRRLLLVLGILYGGCFGWAMTDYQNEHLRERFAKDACQEACTGALHEDELHSNVSGFVSGEGCGCQWDDGTISYVPRRRSWQ